MPSRNGDLTDFSRLPDRSPVAEAVTDSLNLVASVMDAAGFSQTATQLRALAPVAGAVISGNFVVVGQRPLLRGFPLDKYAHTYLEIPEVKNGEWTGKLNTYGVLGEMKNGKGTGDNQQVRPGDDRNGDKPGSDRNHHYLLVVAAAQRDSLTKGAIWWTQHTCPSCGTTYDHGDQSGDGYNSNTWTYNMLIQNPAGRIEPPLINGDPDPVHQREAAPGWLYNDVDHDYYPQWHPH